MFTDFYENDDLSSLGDNINPPNLKFENVQYNDNINNISHFWNLNESNLFPENKEPDCSSFNMNSYSMPNLEKQNTKWETLKKSNAFSPEYNKEDESNCKLVSLEEIKAILTNNITNKQYSEICQKLIKNDNIEDNEYRLINKKRRRENKVLFKNEKETGDKNKSGKRGRKIKEGNQNPHRMEHNKNSEDNIIIKIKAKILLYPLMFLNKILERNNKNILYKIDYNYINRLKKLKI